MSTSLVASCQEGGDVPGEGGTGQQELQHCSLGSPMARASFLQSCAFANQSCSLLSLWKVRGLAAPLPSLRVWLSRMAIVSTVEFILMPGLGDVPKQNTNGPWQRGTSGLGPDHTEKSRPAIIPIESCSACGIRCFAALCYLKADLWVCRTFGTIQPTSFVCGENPGSLRGEIFPKSRVH